MVSIQFVPTVHDNSGVYNILKHGRQYVHGTQLAIQKKPQKRQKAKKNCHQLQNQSAGNIKSHKSTIYST